MNWKGNQKLWWIFDPNQSVTFARISKRTNIRIYSREKKVQEQMFKYICINNLTRKNVWIYSYKQIWHERMSEYIRKRKIDTNECPNIYSWPIYSNIRIFEYIRHTLAWKVDSANLFTFRMYVYILNIQCNGSGQINLYKWPTSPLPGPQKKLVEDPFNQGCLKMTN